jgi:hypothetical protein
MVFCIATLDLPSRDARLNPAFSNMLTVPDHIRLAPLLGLVDGYASTTPPPFFLDGGESGS